MSQAQTARLNRAKMAQDRSHASRKKIVKSALKLWSERGFENGFDKTSVEEIAEQAGFSRATVYYYFPKKEDILRELAWITAEEIHETAIRALLGGATAETTLAAIARQLGETVARTPQAAIRRMLQLRDLGPESLARDARPGGFTRAFTITLLHGQETGELPEDVSAAETAEILSAICMSAITRWSLAQEPDLTATLARRTRFTLAGMRATGTRYRRHTGRVG